MSPLVKIICGACGRLMGRIVESDGEQLYQLVVGGGGVTLDPGAVFCPDHGWLDPNAEADTLVKKIAQARKSGRVQVLRATPSRRKPIPS